MYVAVCVHGRGVEELGWGDGPKMIDTLSGPGLSGGTELQHSSVDTASHRHSHAHTKTLTTGINTRA